MPKKIIIFLIIIALACTGIYMTLIKNRSANVDLNENSGAEFSDSEKVVDEEKDNSSAENGGVKSGGDLSGIDNTGNDTKNIVAGPDGNKDKTFDLSETPATDKVSENDEVSVTSGTEEGTDGDTGKTEAGTEAPENGSGVDENFTSPDTGESGEEKNDNYNLGPVDILTKFYSYSDSPDKYNEALTLLADDFTFKLSVLEQFGISELTKKDISGSQLSVYADLLMTAKIESIENEVRSEGICTITYYQKVEQEGNIYRAKFMAVLKETDGKWLICSISDVV